MLNLDFDLPYRTSPTQIMNLNFNVPCRTSLRCCSRGSPGFVRFEFVSDKTCI